MSINVSVQFSRSVVSGSLRPHELQHARFLCPPPSPGVCSNSSTVSRWRYLTILSSAVPFSFCLQSFPASGSFTVSRLFTSGGRSTGASVSASVRPVNIQGWLPLRARLGSLSLFTFMHWIRKWQPTPVFLPGESQGWGSLVGCLLWGRTELDMTEAT